MTTVPVLAVEGAVGRTVPGLWIMPQAGVVGPSPGFSFTVMPIGYVGSITGAPISSIPGGRAVPLTGLLIADISASASVNFLIPRYVYKTETRKVSFASTFIGPVNWVGVTGSLQPNGFARNNRSVNAGFADAIISPLAVGIHFSDTNNLAISALIFAPTGAFTPGNMSNVGLNTWTIMPHVAHTYLWEKRGLELSNLVGFDIYSENVATKYTSGTMFHWDGMLIQYLSKTFGVGAIVSNLTQITNDTGVLADLLHGFKGRAWGAGPIVVHVLKADKPSVTIQFRWVPEFEVTNLTKGNTLLLGLTVKLN